MNHNPQVENYSALFLWGEGMSIKKGKQTPTRIVKSLRFEFYLTMGACGATRSIREIFLFSGSVISD